MPPGNIRASLYFLLICSTEFLHRGLATPGSHVYFNQGPISYQYTIPTDAHSRFEKSSGLVLPNFVSAPSINRPVFSSQSVSATRNIVTRQANTNCVPPTLPFVRGQDRFCNPDGMTQQTQVFRLRDTQPPITKLREIEPPLIHRQIQRPFTSGILPRPISPIRTVFAQPALTPNLQGFQQQNGQDFLEQNGPQAFLPQNEQRFPQQNGQVFTQQNGPTNFPQQVGQGFPLQNGIGQGFPPQEAPQDFTGQNGLPNFQQAGEVVTQPNGIPNFPQQGVQGFTQQNGQQSFSQQNGQDFIQFTGSGFPQLTDQRPPQSNVPRPNVPIFTLPPLNTRRPTQRPLTSGLLPRPLSPITFSTESALPFLNIPQQQGQEFPQSIPQVIPQQNGIQQFPLPDTQENTNRLQDLEQRFNAFDSNGGVSLNDMTRIYTKFYLKPHFYNRPRPIPLLPTFTQLRTTFPLTTRLLYPQFQFPKRIPNYPFVAGGGAPAPIYNLNNQQDAVVLEVAPSNYVQHQQRVYSNFQNLYARQIRLLPHYRTYHPHPGFLHQQHPNGIQVPLLRFY